ncbi:site-specific recombinase XerD [Dysgonomonas sp. PFB1-18]|nr:site-specific recombinase XerD [Dysgonomonas sp. PF1-14]MDH6339769.1 site-specific recombinase XerD [Dysgonomonas sp. PF1-16]MDH6381417.1 site-specific recombinase XerD [Dysgonomonas sp. PFB1-18]MDH6398632.1 site-specific recombinase XerD [Dysgonomonas sp. PF1-23]
MTQLRKDDIQVTFDNRKWIFIKRKKTKQMSHIPLLPIPLELIEKYQKNRQDAFLFPIHTNQKTNEYLKEIDEICNINKRITFHTARHSFATLALSHGVSIESISGVLGHTNIKTTQIYAQITKQKIGREMTAFENSLDTSNKHANRMKKGYTIYMQLLDTARKMREDDFSTEQIVYYTGLSAEEVAM